MLNTTGKYRQTARKGTLVIYAMFGIQHRRPHIPTPECEKCQDIAIVQSCHGDLRNNHLKECREGGENTELVSIEAEACGCSKVTVFHDHTGWSEHFGMFLVDYLETGRTLQVAWSRGKLAVS